MVWKQFQELKERKMYEEMKRGSETMISYCERNAEFVESQRGFTRYHLGEGNVDFDNGFLLGSSNPKVIATLENQIWEDAQNE